MSKKKETGDVRSQLESWGRVVRHMGNRMDRDIKAWREEEPPQREVVVTDVNGEAATLGVWVVDEPEGVSFALRRKAGYFPYERVFVPREVVEAGMALGWKTKEVKG